MRKKLLTIALAVCMVLSLMACGSKGDDTADSAAESSVSETADAENETSASEEPAAEETSEPEESAAEEETGMTLESWVQSDEARQAEDLTNASLAESGMTVKLKADGDILVYEYTMPDSDDYSSLSTEDLEAAFGPVIEQYEADITEVYDSFDSEYGIRLAGVRFSFILADGTELYSGETMNE